MRLCQESCPDGYNNVSHECREHCPNRCTGKDKDYTCVENCTAPDIPWFVEAGQLTLNCESDIYDNVTRECLTSTDNCVFYKRIWGKLVCVHACDSEEVVYGLECVNPCPNGYYEEAGNCVAACASGVHDETKCISGVAECTHFREENGAFSCFAACSTGEFELGKRCVVACPAGMFVDASGKKCVESCSEAEQWRFKQVGEDRYCMGANAECKYFDVFADGSKTLTRCWDVCPRYVSGKTCVEVCPEGMVLQFSECVSRCEPGWFLNAGRCVDSCPKKVYDNTTRNCLESALTCGLFYNVMGERKVQNSDGTVSTEEYIIVSVCVKSCPEGRVRSGRECVTSCPDKGLVENGVCVTQCSIGLHEGSTCLMSCPAERPFERDKQCVSVCGRNEVIREVEGRLKCQDSAAGCRFVQMDDDGVIRCVASCALVSATPGPRGTLLCTESCPWLRKEIEPGSGVYRCESICGSAEMIDETAGVCVQACPRGTRADGRECVKRCPDGSAPDDDGQCAGLRGSTRVWSIGGWTIVGLGVAALVLIPTACLVRIP